MNWTSNWVLKIFLNSCKSWSEYKLWYVDEIRYTFLITEYGLVLATTWTVYYYACKTVLFQKHHSTGMISKLNLATNYAETRKICRSNQTVGFNRVELIIKRPDTVNCFNPSIMMIGMMYDNYTLYRRLIL